MTATIYNMDQPNSYAAPVGNGLYTYEIAGTNNHKGIELTAQGKLTPELTLVGGFNAVNARVVSDPGNTSVNGNMPSGVSPLSGKLYAEYTIPYSDPLAFLKGLTLVGGFQAASWYYYDEPNMTRIPGHITFDLGFRYVTKLNDHPLIVRFNANNITNAAYYVYHAEGPPRTFLATAELRW